MKNIFSKAFAIFLCLIFAACAPKDDKPVQIRIVDLQGKAHPFNTRIPELNAQAMANQNMAHQGYQGGFENSASQAGQPQQIAQNTAPTPDYGTLPTQELHQTLQTQTKQNAAPTVNSQPSPETAMGAGALSEEQDKAVEYDLAEPEQIAKKPVKKAGNSKTKISDAKEATASKGIFVQVGSFTNINSAKHELTKMEKFHKGKVESVTTGKAGGKTIYRVLLGPFQNKTKANAVVKKITDSGHEAILTKR